MTKTRGWEETASLTAKLGETFVGDLIKVSDKFYKHLPMIVQKKTNFGLLVSAVVAARSLRKAALKKKSYVKGFTFSYCVKTR